MSLANIFAKTTSALSSVLGSALYVVIFGGLLAGLVAQLQITPVVGTQQVAVVLPFAVAGMLLVAWLSEKFLPLLTLPYNDWIYCGRVRRFRMIVRWPMLAQLVVFGFIGAIVGFRCGGAAGSALGTVLSITVRVGFGLHAGFGLPHLLKSADRTANTLANVNFFDSELASDAYCMSWLTSRRRSHSPLHPRWWRLQLAYRRSRRRSYVVMWLGVYVCAYMVFANILNPYWRALFFVTWVLLCVAFLKAVVLPADRGYGMTARWPDRVLYGVVLGIAAGTLPLLLGYASLVHVVVCIVAVMGAAWHMKKPRRVENFGMDDMGVGVLIPTGLLLYAWGRYWPFLLGMLAVAFL